MSISASLHVAGHVFTAPKANIINSRCSVRVWSWFSASDCGSIQRVEKMSDEDYVALLDDKLIPIVWARNGLQAIHLMSDSSPIFPHSFNSGLLRDWFKDHPEIKHDSFPKKSEDLNPFLILWSEFVDALRLQRLQPENPDELWAGIEELWFYRSLKSSYWDGLVQSFRANLRTIVDSEGSA